MVDEDGCRRVVFEGVKEGKEGKKERKQKMVKI